MLAQTSSSAVRATRFTGSTAALRPALRSVRGREAAPLRISALFQRSGSQKKDQKKGKGKGGGYDKDAFQTDPLRPAFTRRREVFAGRLAMGGFAFALLGEIITGKGALGQLQQELGVPSLWVDALVFGTIAYSVLGGILPGSPTYDDENQADVGKRRPGATNNPKKNLIKDPQETLGVSSFGFTRGNEIFVGRTAQLGFLAAIIGEKATGLGPLKQFGLETGIPVGQASIGLLAFISFFLVAALFTGNLTDDEDKSQF